MKKLIVFFLFIVLSGRSFSQQINPPPPLSKQDYLQKSKKQRTAGRVLLATGAALIATAFIIPKGDSVNNGITVGVWSSQEYENDGIKTAFLIAGAASSLGSIPFFIASKKNQKKALNTTFILKMEKAVVWQQQSTINEYYPAAGIRINFK